MKKQNKKVLTFLTILILCGVGGGVLGFLSTFFQMEISDMLQIAKQGLLATSLWFMVGIAVLFTLIPFLFYRKGKSIYENGDLEKDETFDLIDNALGKAVGISSLGIIFGMTWFGFSIAAVNQELISLIEMGILAVVFIVYSVSIVFFQRKYINFTKKVNPEKHGDALDFSFQKTWLESCDEQEKLQTYKAAYKAYISTQILYPFLFLVIILAMLNFNIGIFPILFLGFLWTFQTIVYLKNATK